MDLTKSLNEALNGSLEQFCTMMTVASDPKRPIKHNVRMYIFILPPT
ncbi:hypothetical protein VCHA53O466_40244 [Vibrio chagasii]|nr:hypothetical protein VCHA53O466_40244 [Vibrio chagasii]